MKIEKLNSKKFTDYLTTQICWVKNIVHIFNENKYVD